MELSKKTTILLSPELHDQLVRLASHKGLSMGQLVREACEKTYGLTTTAVRLDSVRCLAALSLPVDDVSRMKEQSVPAPDEILP